MAQHGGVRGRFCAKSDVVRGTYVDGRFLYPSRFRQPEELSDCLHFLQAAGIPEKYPPVGRLYDFVMLKTRLNTQ
jgi:hypothetical protein